MIAEVVRDLLLACLADDPAGLVARSGTAVPADPESFGPRRRARPGDRSSRRRSSGTSSPRCARCCHNPGARERAVPTGDRRTGRRLVECVADAVTEVERRQQARRADRLRPPRQRPRCRARRPPRTGPQLADQLAARYRLVLVDEFQDTDRLQWEIFDRAFADHRLITVGDPKQAIFRFRGADVHAYLDAVRSAQRDDAAHQPPLRPATARRPRPAVRRRSPRPCRHRVRPRRRQPSRSAQRPRRGAGPPARRARRPSCRPHGAGHGGRCRCRPRARRRRLARCARCSTRRRSERAGDTRHGAAVRHRHPRPVAAPGRGDGQRVARMGHPDRPCPHRVGACTPACRGAVAAAARRTGDAHLCTRGPGGRTLVVLRRFPSRARRTAWWCGADGDTDTRLAQLQRQFGGTRRATAQRWRRRALRAAARRARRCSTPCSARPNGDRDLTDLDHLAELLVAEFGGKPAEPSAVRRCARPDDRRRRRPQSRRRCAGSRSDDDAVHITTVHSAKGLEYPVVLVPFAYTERPAASRPYVYNEADGRVVDVASWVAWGDGVDEGGKEALAALGRTEAARQGRGRRRWVTAALCRPHPRQAPSRDLVGADAGRRDVGTRSAAARSLGCRPRVQLAARRRLRERRTRPPRASRSMPWWLRRMARSPASTSRSSSPCAHRCRCSPRRRACSPSPTPAVATTRRSSSADVVVHGDHVPAGQLAAGPGDRRARRRRVRRTAAERRGGRAGSGADSSEPLVGAPRRALPLGSAPGGTTFGIAVHEVLEMVDFTSPTLRRRYGRASSAKCRGGPVWCSTCRRRPPVSMAVVDTPLGEQFDHRPLR